MADSRVLAKQNSVENASEGNWVAARADRTGIQFTANWKEALVLEGRVHTFMVGALETGIVGGGNGTTIDADQPEFVVSVPSGTSLIPLEITIAFGTDLNAAAEVAQALVIADTAAAYDDSGTVTTETPVNLLSGGGVTTVATAVSACTVNMTAPTESHLIAAEAWGFSILSSTGGSGTDYTLHYLADIPHILKGPAAFYGYWGATGAATGWAKVTWAEVPDARFTI